MIVEGQLAAGEWINEIELCQQLQISRTPLREALKVLAAEGLVELVPRRGAHVAQLSVREIVDLFEALGGVEGLRGRDGRRSDVGGRSRSVAAAAGPDRTEAQGEEIGSRISTTTRSCTKRSSVLRAIRRSPRFTPG